MSSQDGPGWSTGSGRGAWTSFAQRRTPESRRTRLRMDARTRRAERTGRWRAARLMVGRSRLMSTTITVRRAVRSRMLSTAAVAFSQTMAVVAFYAVLRLGAIVVEHNPTYTAEVRAHMLLGGGVTPAHGRQGGAAAVLSIR